MEEQRPLVRVGTYCLVVSPDDTLLLAEQRHRGVVEWGSFGGALEAHESLEECAIREIREETGLTVRIKRLLAADEDWREGKLDGLGFIFLAEPDPWPQEVKLASSDGPTTFLRHRWVTRDEARRLLAPPNADAAWMELWLHDQASVPIRTRKS